jgi:hypothetical protein
MYEGILVLHVDIIYLPRCFNIFNVWEYMLYTQYTKQRNAKTWEKFRQQRNLVTKLKTKSMKNYLLECCSGGAKTCNFGTTVKPFCSKKKCNSGEQKIILCENLFIQGSGFFLGRLVLTGACLFSICMKESWYCM